jgi:hypothetical protein
MKTLKFQDDIELDEVFNQHKIEIYDNLLNSIKANYLNPKLNEITIVKILIKDTDYTINLSRDKFVSGLNNAITFYEGREEYEKCSECVEIIKEIEKK